MAGVTNEEVKEARRLSVWGTIIVFLATFSQSLVGIIGYFNDVNAYCHHYYKFAFLSANSYLFYCSNSIYIPNYIVMIFDWITLFLILPHFYYISVYWRWSKEENPMGVYRNNRNRGERGRDALGGYQFRDRGYERL